MECQSAIILCFSAWWRGRLWRIMICPVVWSFWTELADWRRHQLSAFFHTAMIIVFGTGSASMPRSPWGVRRDRAVRVSWPAVPSWQPSSCDSRSAVQAGRLVAAQDGWRQRPLHDARRLPRSCGQVSVGWHLPPAPPPPSTFCSLFPRHVWEQTHTKNNKLVFKKKKHCRYTKTGVLVPWWNFHSISDDGKVDFRL